MHWVIKASGCPVIHSYLVSLSVVWSNEQRNLNDGIWGHIYVPLNDTKVCMMLLELCPFHDVIKHETLIVLNKLIKQTQLDNHSITLS
jgi:hypothetical protein